MQRQDELDRIPIEGKFGQGKRRFSLDRIMAKLAETSEAVIMVSFIVMNLEKILSSRNTRRSSSTNKTSWRLLPRCVT